MKALFPIAIAAIAFSSCTSKISENVAGSANAGSGSNNVAASSDNASQNTQVLQSNTSSDVKAIKSTDAPNAKQVDWSNR
jgi:hypothetical protein